ncbi:MAG: prolyl oligopeptidase family serine peptidase [Pseudomonadota bacterium]
MLRILVFLKVAVFVPLLAFAQITQPPIEAYGDDFVVKDRQSKIMESALKKAGKEVEFVQMRGEDHSLSTPGARLEALKAMDTFVQKHIGE